MKSVFVLFWPVSSSPQISEFYVNAAGDRAEFPENLVSLLSLLNKFP